MSQLQEQAVQMIQNLSDDNIEFLIEIIQRLMLPKINPETIQLPSNDPMQAFHRLNTARAEIRQYLPDDFDPDKELEMARAERYDSLS